VGEMSKCRLQVAGESAGAGASWRQVLCQAGRGMGTGREVKVGIGTSV
jgi:hypothetical protein